MEINSQILEKVDMTKGEARVYLALLEIGETTTGKIIEEAEISAGKVYQILDKLIKKGLVKYIIKGKTKYFSATHPNRIIDLFHEKEKEIKKKEQDMKDLLPSLIKNYESKKPICETNAFRGMKGLQTAIFEMLENLSPSDKILAMGIMTSKDKKFNILWEKWHKERQRRKIKCLCLFSELNKEYIEVFKKLKFTEVKILEGVTPSAITIAKDYVLIQTYKEGLQVLSIKDKNISQSFENFFKTLWGQAR